MESEQFSVSWDNFHKNMSSGIHSLLELEDFVDVTLAVEGRYLKAHKMVLSVCSSYFKELFKTTPCKHPIVFMKDVSYTAMSDLLRFMYQGEVQVNQQDFNMFIKTAEALQIRGLSNYDNGSHFGSCGREETEKNTVSHGKTNNLPTPVPKRPRLSEPTTPTSVPVVKTEPGAEPPATTSNSDTSSIQFKIESEDQHEEKCFFDNFSDDPLDDTNDDYWMMGGGDDESQTGLLVAEELIPSDVEESASPMLPAKSKDKYEYTFTRFEQWCSENDVKNLNEEVLLTYFKEKSLNYKASSLWSSYSMLRSTIAINRNVDISTYRSLLAFLKSKSIGYQAKRSVAFKREDFERFLREADNNTYLLMKVAMVIGVVGACSNLELTNILTENVIDEGNFFRINVPDNRSKTCREFILTSGTIRNINVMEIIRQYIRVRADHQRFFVSYRNGKCVKQPVGVHTFGAIPKNIAQFLGLKNPERYTGHCFKRTSASLRLVPQHVHF